MVSKIRWSIYSENWWSIMPKYPVNIINNVNATVIRNYFLDPLHDLSHPHGNYGVRIANHGNNSHTVSSNIFTNFTHSIYAVNMAYPDLYFDENSINNSDNITEGLNGIYVGNSGLSSNSNVQITGNYIKHAITGIHLSGIGNAYIGGLNEIAFDPADLGTIHYGIRIDGGKQNQIEGNYIHKTDGLAYTDKTKLYGIRIQSSDQNTVLSNLINYLGRAISFYDINPGQMLNTVQCNQMDTCLVGVSFEKADIGNQGTLSNDQQNIWYIPAISNTYKSHERQFSSVNPTWYVNQTTNGLPFRPANAYMNPVGFLAWIGGATQNGCNIPCPGCNNQRMAEAVTGQGDYAALTPDDKYLSNKSIYDLLKKDSSYMYANLPSDAVLQNFYDSATVTNIGILGLVDDLIDSSSLFLADMVNNWVYPQNNFEENRKTVNGIYLATWAQGIFEFDNTHIANLNSIAYQNPVYGGDAVYSARVMLNLMIDDSLTQYGNGQREIQSIMPKSTDIDFDLNPNPAVSEVLINIISSSKVTWTYRIIDPVGKLIKSQMGINATWIKVSLSGINNGVYYVEVNTAEGRCLKKLIVSK